VPTALSTLGGKAVRLLALAFGMPNLGRNTLLKSGSLRGVPITAANSPEAVVGVEIDVDIRNSFFLVK
jgi:hypothetical protein